MTGAEVITEIRNNLGVLRDTTVATTRTSRRHSRNLLDTYTGGADPATLEDHLRFLRNYDAAYRDRLNAARDACDTMLAADPDPGVTAGQLRFRQAKRSTPAVTSSAVTFESPVLTDSLLVAYAMTNDPEANLRMDDWLNPGVSGTSDEVHMRVFHSIIPDDLEDRTTFTARVDNDAWVEVVVVEWETANGEEWHPAVSQVATTTGLGSSATVNHAAAVTGSGTSAALPARSFGSNDVGLLWVYSERASGGGQLPTIDYQGVTWTQIDSWFIGSGGRHRLTLMAADVRASNGNGGTVSFGAAQDTIMVQIQEADSIDLSEGIVEAFATNLASNPTGTSGAAAAQVGVGQVTNSDDLIIGCCLNTSSTTISKDLSSAWATLHQHGTGRVMHTQQRNGDDTEATWTWTPANAASVIAVAVVLRAIHGAAALEVSIPQADSGDTAWTAWTSGVAVQGATTVPYTFTGESMVGAITSAGRVGVAYRLDANGGTHGPIAAGWPGGTPRAGVGVTIGWQAGAFVPPDPDPQPATDRPAINTPAEVGPWATATSGVAGVGPGHTIGSLPAPVDATGVIVDPVTGTVTITEDYPSSTYSGRNLRLTTAQDPEAVFPATQRRGAFLIVQKANLFVTGCLLRGYVVDNAISYAQRPTFRWCDIGDHGGVRGQAEGGSQKNGQMVGPATVQRCWVHGMENFWHLVNTGAVIEENWISDSAKWDSPKGSDQGQSSHPDIITCFAGNRRALSGQSNRSNDHARSGDLVVQRNVVHNWGFKPDSGHLGCQYDGTTFTPGTKFRVLTDSLRGTYIVAARGQNWNTTGSYHDGITIVGNYIDGAYFILTNTTEHSSVARDGYTQPIAQNITLTDNVIVERYSPWGSFNKWEAFNGTTPTHKAQVTIGRNVNENGVNYPNSAGSNVVS